MQFYIIRDWGRHGTIKVFYTVYDHQRNMEKRNVMYLRDGIIKEKIIHKLKNGTYFPVNNTFSIRINRLILMDVASGINIEYFFKFVFKKAFLDIKPALSKYNNLEILIEKSFANGFSEIIEVSLKSNMFLMINLSRDGTFGNLKVKWLFICENLRKSGNVFLEHGEENLFFLVDLRGEKLLNINCRVNLSQSFTNFNENSPFSNNNIFENIFPFGLLLFEEYDKPLYTNEKIGFLKVKLLRLFGAQGGMIVSYKCLDLSTRLGDDYIQSENQLIFQEGSFTAEIKIILVDDNITENDESFIISITEIKCDGSEICPIYPKLTEKKIIIVKNDYPSDLLTLSLSNMIANEPDIITINIKKNFKVQKSVSFFLKTYSDDKNFGLFYDQEKQYVTDFLDLNKNMTKAEKNIDYLPLYEKIVMDTEVYEKAVNLYIRDDLIRESKECLLIYIVYDPPIFHRMANVAKTLFIISNDLPKAVVFFKHDIIYLEEISNNFLEIPVVLENTMNLNISIVWKLFNCSSNLLEKKHLNGTFLLNGNGLSKVKIYISEIYVSENASTCAFRINTIDANVIVENARSNLKIVFLKKDKNNSLWEFDSKFIVGKFSDNFIEVPIKRFGLFENQKFKISIVNFNEKYGKNFVPFPSKTLLNKMFEMQQNQV